MRKGSSPDDFPSTAASLRSILQSLQNELSDWREIGSEKFQELKTQIPVAWKNRSNTLAHYKELLRQMPKELRQREFFKKSQQDLERFETEVSLFLTELKELSFEEYCARIQSHKNTYPYWNAFLQRLQQTQVQISELEQNTLVQKFLRGETVLSSKSNIQWARKIGHMAFGLFFLFLFQFSGISKTLFWSISSVFIVWAISLETARHLNPKVNDWVCKWFKPVMRECEKDKINSAIFYMFSLLVVYAIFPLPITILSLLFLAVGDPVAGVVGVKFGKT